MRMQTRAVTVPGLLDNAPPKVVPTPRIEELVTICVPLSRTGTAAEAWRLHQFPRYDASADELPRSRT